MGLFDSKSSIIGAALGVSGAFDKSRKTDKAAAFGAALGASIGLGQKWIMADSLRLGAAISDLDAGKEDTSSSYVYSGSSHSSDDYGIEDYSFLYEFLRSKDAIDYLMQFMKGDNSPSIRKDDLLGLVINLPSYEEQQIVFLLNDLLLKEEQAKDKACEVIENIELMKKSILAKAFRGELGTNNSNEESAIELLKFILEQEGQVKK